MPTVNIEDKLYGEMKEYCKLNNLTVTSLVNDLLKEGFSVKKYGDMPPFFRKVKSTDEFRQECLREPEPIKRKEYEEPKVLSVEVKRNDAEPTDRERARNRVKYL